MNTRLLRKIAREILARPDQIEMESWFKRKRGAGPCNTTACIAGWAYTMTQPKAKLMPLAAARLIEPQFGKKRHSSFPFSDFIGLGRLQSEYLVYKARRALRITPEQSSRLFHYDNWPEAFQKRPRNRKLYARVVSDRIEHFIKTKGKE